VKPHKKEFKVQGKRRKQLTRRTEERSHPQEREVSTLPKYMGEKRAGITRGGTVTDIQMGGGGGIKNHAGLKKKRRAKRWRGDLGATAAVPILPASR